MQEEHFEFFDELRESGTVNMFGAARVMCDEGLAELSLAKKFLAHWMETFEERHSC